MAIESQHIHKTPDESKSPLQEKRDSSEIQVRCDAQRMAGQVGQP
jgi:hypothetical protein